MGSEQIQLSEKDVLDKEFKVAMRGYNQEEVDKFLDIIIEDYALYKKEIERLTNENNRLKNKTHRARPNPVSQPVQSAQPAQPAQPVNYDVLKRLSNLEKEVFGRRDVNS